MSAPLPCPDLEVLFGELAEGSGAALEHARTCAACSAVVEEHRQLEKDLLRLADPLPPPTLVAGVMARVVAEPVPLRRELWTGLSILGLSVCLALVLFVSSDAALGWAGSALATLAGEGHVFLGGLVHGLHALWLLAAAPVALAATGLLLASLFALQRAAGPAPSDYSEA